MLLITFCFVNFYPEQTATARSFQIENIQTDDQTEAVSLVNFKRAPASITVTPKATPVTNYSYDFLPAESLKPRVDFWINVYTRLTTSQGLLHDSKYVDIVYETLDFKDLREGTHSHKEQEKKIGDQIKVAKKKIEATLLSLHLKQKNPSSLNAEETRIYDMFKSIQDPNKFLEAAGKKRLRFQLGQRDRFLQGLYYSGRYLPIMEKIFKDQGLPIELTRLPFVESTFDLRARSKVGASGIWQFMPSTGRLFMKINEAIDERNDPIRATVAAAQFMANNFNALGSWPLAITAYNHGTLGMVRAVEKTKSRELSDIIDRYKSPSFGFASSNFYAEFLAAVEVEKHASRYFDKAEIDRAIEFAEFVLTDFIDLKDIATYTKIPLDTLQELNPGLTESVFNSTRLVPSGYVLRIPPQERESFLMRYNDIPGYRKLSAQKGPLHDYYASGRRPSAKSWGSGGF